MPNISTKLIRVGHSPDADDAFMFYALAHKKIDMRGFEVEHVIEDIESLNQRAIGNLKSEPRAMDHGPRKSRESNRGSCSCERSPDLLEVTAVSCHAYAYLADRYAVMRSGASVGDNYGPILVARATHHDPRTTDKTRTTNLAPRTPWPAARGPWDEKNRGPKIAIPGKLTTAYLVLQLYQNVSSWPVVRGPWPVFMPFDQIIDAVKSGEVDYGLIIHEGQITYAEHGLEKVVDLGQWWHETTKLPLPLGVDVIRKDLGPGTMRSFAKLFKESIEYALSHRKEALEYARQFGRGISEDLNDRFVTMYVNDRTIDIGEDGEAGFCRLLDEAFEHKIIPKKINLEFV